MSKSIHTLKDNLPTDFIARLPLDEYEKEQFLNSFTEEVPVSIRINPKKQSFHFDDADRISWCKEGRYLPERISFTLDPLFHAGTYYVQEASSMMLEQVFKELIESNHPLNVLDLCAAPGGKSTHLLSLLPAGSVLVSNEIISTRNSILHYNITKWGNDNCIVTQNKAADFAVLSGFFDVILVDAPCSGEGLFRKDQEAISEWNVAHVNGCAIRQNQILDEVLPCLKEGGLLIYSTCTFEAVENDLQMERLINDYQYKSIALENIYQGKRTKYGIQFYPHLSKGEGFYLSVLRKTSEENSFKSTLKKQTIQKIPAKLEIYFNQPVNFNLILKNEMMYAIPDFMEKTFALIQSALYIKKAGIEIGTMKGQDFIPSHELALFTGINKEISSIEVDKITALRFLKCEQIQADTLQKGWHLIRHQGFALGWAKAVQGRINNYFPKNQRILMDVTNQQANDREL
jgi:16S rRNA C967 or C1407 C5-methylase (RsmB/RsmF family)/NOL1/NOP2/fmu family ribosome biogenesis protein